MGARAVGQLAEELSIGYMAYAASAEVLGQPEVALVMAAMQARNPGPAAVPTGLIMRSDGTAHYYNTTHFITRARSDAPFREVYDRLWLAGALLTLGDRITDEGGFDRGPDLEFIRHLRNGIAHGNRFHFHTGEPKRPAHFMGAAGIFPSGDNLPEANRRRFEITSALEGQPVLFDYISPGDICDLLMFVSTRLISMASGDVRHIWPQ